tara:strand:+ start:44800 stop:45498 length:699 start_codon:yes stop_codon:yes gene_type:complete
MKAVILAGGLGKRVRPYTLFLPKPMLPLGNEPILGHLINWVKKQGINEIIICTSYMSDIIENHFENGEEYGIDIKYVKANKPLGTAGQLKSAQKYLKDDFLCIYSDSLFNFKINDVIKFHKKNKPLVTMTVCNYETRIKYGMIELNDDKSVSEWKEKPLIKGMINTGCFIINYELLKYIPKNRKFEMDQVFKKIQKDNHKIFGFPVKGDILDLGDKTEYEKNFKEYNTSGKK